MITLQQVVILSLKLLLSLDVASVKIVAFGTFVVDNGTTTTPEGCVSKD